MVEACQGMESRNPALDLNHDEQEVLNAHDAEQASLMAEAVIQVAEDDRILGQFQPKPPRTWIFPPSLQRSSLQFKRRNVAPAFC